VELAVLVPEAVVAVGVALASVVAVEAGVTAVDGVVVGVALGAGVGLVTLGGWGLTGTCPSGSTY